MAHHAAPDEDHGVRIEAQISFGDTSQSGQLLAVREHVPKAGGTYVSDRTLGGPARQEHRKQDTRFASPVSMASLEAVAFSLDRGGARPGTASVRHDDEPSLADPVDPSCDGRRWTGPQIEHAGHRLAEIPDPARRRGLDAKPVGVQVPNGARLSGKVEPCRWRPAVPGARTATAVGLRRVPAGSGHTPRS